MLQEKKLTEIVQLAALKRARTGKNRVKVYLPPMFLPPKEVKVYRTVRVEGTLYGTVDIFCRPAEEGGWELFVRFSGDQLNPAIPKAVGEELLKKLKA